jgi:uncharacterized LabA/DUF88 family protein
MAKVVFMIDGWFMRKRIMKTKAFYYSGPNIRSYCSQFLYRTDTFYRIFYYDTAPLMEKGHNPISKKFIDFSETPVAKHQWELFESIKTTPNFALRLGSVVWRNRGWLVRPDKFKELLSGKISIGTLSESDVEPHIEQKAVDMKIGLDIASIAMKRLADTLIVISGDADLVPALKLARREGMLVGLDALGCRVRPELREHVDFFTTKIAQNLIDG